MLRSQTFDLVVLDINLPDIDGFEVIKQIRSFPMCPPLWYTVRGREEDKVKGLELGADDYIIKHFQSQRPSSRG